MQSYSYLMKEDSELSFMDIIGVFKDNLWLKPRSLKWMPYCYTSL